MRRIQAVVTVLPLIGLALGASKCHAQPRAAFRVVPPEVASFSITVGNREVTMSQSAATLRANGDSSAPIRLYPSDSPLVLSKILYDTVGSDLLVVIELTDYETAHSVLTRYRIPELTRVWQLQIPAFNIGPALLDPEGSRVFITATGLIAAIDLDDGRFQWMHDGLYTTDGHFAKFITPRLAGEVVEFQDVPRRGNPRVLRVKLPNGRLLRESK